VLCEQQSTTGTKCKGQFLELQPEAPPCGKKTPSTHPLTCSHPFALINVRSVWRRQYVFAGATMPAEGTKNVADELRERHPGATWLAGRALHQAQAALRHDWRRVDDATRLDVLQACSTVVCAVEIAHPKCASAIAC
jgi:hypothetical protein